MALSGALTVQQMAPDRRLCLLLVRSAQNWTGSNCCMHVWLRSHMGMHSMLSPYHRQCLLQQTYCSRGCSDAIISSAWQSIFSVHTCVAPCKGWAGGRWVVVTRRCASAKPLNRPPELLST